ncbi:DUF6011 domain-containing protein [Streptomyces sp. NPDC060194]|uniref:DUF6011 domain-containing protein n=1 Tax=Streptomyces sp. NPDC060194 TaxID=3347069 RepID=UPI003650AE8C
MTAPDSAPDEPLPGARTEPGDRPRVLCALCGRPLRDRESRRWGLGEGCREKLRLRGATGPGRFEVDQDELPGFG